MIVSEDIILHVLVKKMKLRNCSIRKEMIFFSGLVLACLGLSLGQKVANPVIVLSFDGMRIDKLDEFMRNNSGSNFSKFIANGVRADYMQSSFPSLTFPNHW